MQAVTRESMASSVKNDWGTPRVVLDPLEAMGGIELDPCANLRSVVRCRQHIALPEDGLAASWFDRMPVKHTLSCPGRYDPDGSCWTSSCWSCRPAGLIFVNSPYGRAVKKWQEKCRAEAAKGCEIVSLVAARTDTKWFQENLYATANAVCYWKGRIRFIDLSTGQQGDPAFFPSALAYWGPRTQLFQEAFADKGHIEIIG